VTIWQLSVILKISKRGNTMVKITEILIPKMGNKFKFTFKTIESALTGTNLLLTKELRSASPIEYLKNLDGTRHSIEFIFTDDIDNTVFSELCNFTSTELIDVKVEHLDILGDASRIATLVNPTITHLKTSNFDYNNKGLMTLHLIINYQYAKDSNK
jgi:hypothetical protein